MKPEIVLAFEFVEYIPEKLEERTLYISKTYGTAVHKCFCGCGREVVTPLSATGWKLTFDGQFVSLYPSIGSWNLPCQSHYFITKNRVVWAPHWTQEKIDAGRAQEAKARERHYAPATPQKEASPIQGTANEKPRKNLWQTIKGWFT